MLPTMSAVDRHPKTMHCITCADCHPHFVSWPVDSRFVSIWNFFPAAVYSNWTIVGCFAFVVAVYFAPSFERSLDSSPCQYAVPNPYPFCDAHHHCDHCKHCWRAWYRVATGLLAGSAFQPGAYAAGYAGNDTYCCERTTACPHGILPDTSHRARYGR